MSDSSVILAELLAIRADIAALREQQRTERHALKRAAAAVAMGISRRKLEKLIATGKVRTASDEHLVPLSEVRRYCAPKTPRQRKPAVGYRARMRNVDSQSDEAFELATKALRRKRASDL